jgi:hypothetical protein
VSSQKRVLEASSSKASSSKASFSGGMTHCAWEASAAREGISYNLMGGRDDVNAVMSRAGAVKFL